jgi:CRISPR/Cas system endoribonuclease Cas6 (RAMP superfamily)
LKLRGTDEVLEKLIESGTLDILSDVIQEVKKTESESKNQLKVLMSLMIDEISAQKSSKSIKKLRLSEQISEEPGRSITARSTQMLTSARSCEFSRASFITRRPSAEVVV